MDPINRDFSEPAERVRLMACRLIGNYPTKEYHHYYTPTSTSLDRRDNLNRDISPKCHEVLLMNRFPFTVLLMNLIEHEGFLPKEKFISRHMSLRVALIITNCTFYLNLLWEKNYLQVRH